MSAFYSVSLSLECHSCAGSHADPCVQVPQKVDCWFGQTLLHSFCGLNCPPECCRWYLGLLSTVISPQSPTTWILLSGEVTGLLHFIKSRLHAQGAKENMISQHTEGTDDFVSVAFLLFRFESYTYNAT